VIIDRQVVSGFKLCFLSYLCQKCNLNSSYLLVMRWLFYLILAIFLMTSHTLSAQKEQYKFRHLTINDGLSHNQVNTIFKDKTGFVWIGTNSGLNRFDGYQVKTYRSDSRDSASLVNNNVIRIAESPDGLLVINTARGLTLYDPRTERFNHHTEAFYRQYDLQEGQILDIIRDYNGWYWFVQSDALTAFDAAKGESLIIRHVKGDTASIYTDPVTSFCVDHAGKYWVVHDNGIVERIAITGKEYTVEYRNQSLFKKNKSRSLNYRMIADSDGELWLVVTNDNQGIYHLNPVTGELSNYTTASKGIRLNTNIVSGLVEDNKGQIWVGTDHGGINIIDKKTESVSYLYQRQEDPATLGQNSINTLYRDNQGIIWIGTYKKGVSYYHEHIFRFTLFKHFPNDPSTLPFPDVNRFAEDEKGNLWIGTNGAGLIYFNRHNGTYTAYRHDPKNPHSLSSDVIVSLCIDNARNLWVGTYYGGLNRFDGKKFIRYNHDPADPTTLSGRNVWEIFQDSQRNLWIGTLEGGVNLYESKSNTFKRLSVGMGNEIRSNYISSITEARNGEIWFGTSGGIDVYVPRTGKFRHYERQAGNALSMSSSSILDILEDSQGRIWIATQEGLDLFDRGKDGFYNVNRLDGGPGSPVVTIQEDQRGHLWLGTPTGLVEMIPGKELNDAVFRLYTESDGLQALQFNENASFKTRSGELVFGGPGGFNIFKPENLQVNKFFTKVVFTDFQLFQKSIGIGERVNGKVILKSAVSQMDRIVLPPDQNFFSVEFSALNFLHPERNDYLYKLDGLHSEWLPVDKNSRKVTFTNLSPDEYVLRIKASNMDGEWPEEETQLAVTVLPPFWKTEIAFVFYVLFVIGILYIARKLVQQREQLKFAIEQERQEAIRMHELDMMKIKFFTNVSHEFRTPLTLILTPLERMLRNSADGELRSQYQLIQRNAKRLLNLVNQLLDFRKMEVQEIRFSPSEGDIISFIGETVQSFSDLSEKKGIQLTFHSSVESLETIFDRDKLEKILFNLLSNAFKFTMEGEVNVAVDTEERNGSGWLKITVRDTGIGIPADKQEKVFERFFQQELPGTMVSQGSGIGLAITKEFVRIHKGEITLESEPGAGTTFTVLIPVPEILPSRTVAPTAELRKEELLPASADPVVAADFPESLKKKTHSILLVEDNDDFRFYLKDNLKLEYEITEASNGEEAWKHVLLRQPDLIVSDVMMPRMNGLDFCKKVKNDERVSHIPVILLTARTSDEQRIEGFQTGADDYITKPFNFEILESRIRNLLMLRQKAQKLFRKTLDVRASELKITPLDTRFIENAIKCVEQNVSSPDFSVEDLGRELGISRAYLYKKVVALTGKAPLEFIRTIRMQHAAQLLEKSQLTVAEVAYRVGFNNPKYFTKYFKEEFHVLPSGYAAFRKKGGT
jgi:signal transduction histidine kinase/ligand-binding sensor domain-containing protein/DNA-binding response OmpR family regulator